MSEEKTPPTTQAPAKTEEKKATPPSPIALFKQQLGGYESRVVKLLSEKYGMSVNEFIQSAENAITKNPKLLECDRKSLFGAILLSAELGLRFNTPEGHAYIIPYGKEAQFQIGYKGWIEMAYRNPRLKSIYASVCYQKDGFEYEEGTFPKLTHKPNITEKDRGDVVFSYAVAKLEGCDPITVVVPKAVLDKIQKLSPAGSSGSSPYNNKTDVHNSMQMKAAIKKLMKLLPKNSAPEISHAIESDDRIMMGAKVRATDSGDITILDKDPNAKNNQYEDQFTDYEEVPSSVDKETGEIKETAPAKTEEKKDVIPPTNSDKTLFDSTKPKEEKKK